ncbi:uncharacterized protein [Eurosta solidaginis]|uniref:uncharacterized protein isoform X2 n=1 Tax=Eurosta solidaginis TaxID=178769 RepID=UPI00353097A5
MRRYNLRNYATSPKMPKSNNDSSSDSEADRTVIQDDTASNLQEQVHKLQLSLEASERGRLNLMKTFASSTTANNMPCESSSESSVNNTTKIYANASTAAYCSATILATAASCPVYTLSHAAANYPIRTSPEISSAAAGYPALTSQHITATAANTAQISTITSNSVFHAHSWNNNNIVSSEQQSPIVASHYAPQRNYITGSHPTNLPPYNFSYIYPTAGASLNAPLSSPIQNSQTQMLMPAYNRKLQDLPQFSGSPEEWPMFIVAFRETTNMFSYTNVENLLRLQKSLKGDARSKVESLLIHPSSVNTLISSLEFHFGRPEVLIRSQLAKARAFPSITSGKVHEIVNLSAMVTNLVAFLENAGALPHLSNPTLLDELVSKLPIYKREGWARHTFMINKPYPTVSEFSLWL